MPPVRHPRKTRTTVATQLSWLHPHPRVPVWGQLPDDVRQRVTRLLGELLRLVCAGAVPSGPSDGGGR
jgi:hypothetical protein